MGRHRSRTLPGFRAGRASFLLPAAAVAAALLIPASPSAGAPTAREEAVLAPAAPDGQIPLLVRTPDAAGLAARVKALGGRVSYVFRNLDALAAFVPPDALDDLRADPLTGSAERQRLVHRAVVRPALPEPIAPGLRYREPEGEFVPLPGADRIRVRSLPLEELATGVLRGEAPASFFGYDILTGAVASWEVTGYGEGVIVAVLDTGIFPGHPMIAGNVIGGENLVPEEEEQAIDLDRDGVPDGRSFDWDSVHNDEHGTFVSGLVAGHAELAFPDDDPFIASVHAHSPESVEFDGAGTALLRLAGQAPGASLYGVKVFPYDGSGAPDARVAEAIDRLIEAKLSGVLDTDVINMSLSGPVLHDGWSPLDRMVDAATDAGITVVSAAANSGPSLLTTGSPASAFTGLAAGGVSDPIHTRVVLETLFGAPPGFGTVIYPHDDPLVVDFAARGPTADHRGKPDLVATAFFTFSSNMIDLDGDRVNDVPSFGFSSGTSFSCPAIAGAAALVTAYGDHLGHHAEAPYVANALRKAAVPIAAFEAVGSYHQGRGFVNVPEALARLDAGDVGPPGDAPVGTAALGELDLRHASTASGSTPPIAPGGTFDFLLHVPDGVTNLVVEFPEVTVEGDGNPAVGEIATAAVHTAQRGGTGDYVFYKGDPFGGSLESGDTFSVPYPEPGRMRVTIGGFLMNYGPVSATVHVTAESDPIRAGRVFTGRLERDETVVHEVTIREGLDALMVTLSWKHDWTRWPTVDLDLLIEGPEGVWPVFSIRSPEMAWIESPAAGTYRFTIVDAGTVTGREPYRLAVAVVEPEAGPREDVDDADRPRLIASGANPARGATEVTFALPIGGAAELKVFDVSGRLVRTLLDGVLEAGRHRTSWDGRTASGERAAAGVYFLRLDTERGSSARKVTLLE